MVDVDLDLNDLIPNSVLVRAGDKTYKVRAELTPAMRVRIARWWRSYTGSFDTELGTAPSDRIDDELWTIVKDILGTDTVQQAALLGSAAAVRLLNFLQNAQDVRNQAIATTTSSLESDSDSSGTTMGA